MVCDRSATQLMDRNNLLHTSHEQNAIADDAQTPSAECATCFRGRVEACELHTCGAGAARDAGRDQSSRRRHWRTGFRLGCSRATPVASSSRGRVQSSSASSAARWTRSNTGRDNFAKSRIRKRCDSKVPPTFGIRWLVPRLARFHAFRPDVDVADHDVAPARQVQPRGCGRLRSFGSAAVARRDCPAAVREMLLPVCSPDLLRRAPPLRNAARSGAARSRVLAAPPARLADMARRGRRS